MLRSRRDLRWCSRLRSPPPRASSAPEHKRQPPRQLYQLPSANNCNTAGLAWNRRRQALARLGLPHQILRSCENSKTFAAIRFGADPLPPAPVRDEPFYGFAEPCFEGGLWTPAEFSSNLRRVYRIS